VDALTVVVLVLAAALLVLIIVAGIVHRSSPLDPLGRSSAREIAARRQALETEDLEQMLELHNARRRARGKAEVTAAEIEAEVTQDPSGTAGRQGAWRAL